MADKTQPVTVRLDRELHMQASVIAKMTGEPFRALVERGLEREVRERMNDAEVAAAVRSFAALVGGTVAG